MLSRRSLLTGTAAVAVPVPSFAFPPSPIVFHRERDASIFADIEAMQERLDRAKEYLIDADRLDPTMRWASLFEMRACLATARIYTDFLAFAAEEQRLESVIDRKKWEAS